MEDDKNAEPAGEYADKCAGVKTREQIEQQLKTEVKDPYSGFMEQWPILFQQRRLPMTRTCMCWGIEAGGGWRRPLEKLCDKLETINLTIGKESGFEIQAVQVKQKFGTLRFYLNVYQTIPFLRRIFGMPFIWFGQRDYEATGLQKKIGDALSDFFYAIGSWICYGSESRQRRYEIVSSTILDYAEDLVYKCEDECYKVCEECGRPIGDERHPRCETRGWISYICEDCAKKCSELYVKHYADGQKRYFMGETDVTDERLKEEQTAENN